MNPFPWRPVLVASVFLWSFFSLPTAAPTPISNDHQLRDSTLTVLTYHVWVGFREVPDRKSRWLEWMKAQEPDIVFLYLHRLFPLPHRKARRSRQPATPGLRLRQR